MPTQFETLNEVAAQGAPAVVHESNRDQDPEAVANGARVTSEAIHRTLGRLGVELPDSFSEHLTLEFIALQEEERGSTYRHLEDIRRFEASA